MPSSKTCKPPQQWWTCKHTPEPFEGCCTKDPCNLDNYDFCLEELRDGYKHSTRQSFTKTQTTSLPTKTTQTTFETVTASTTSRFIEQSTHGQFITPTPAATAASDLSGSSERGEISSAANSKSNMPVIIGGVAGGLVLLIIIAILLLVFRKRRNRQLFDSSQHKAPEMQQSNWFRKPSVQPPDGLDLLHEMPTSPSNVVQYPYQNFSCSVSYKAQASSELGSFCNSRAVSESNHPSSIHMPKEEKFPVADRVSEVSLGPPMGPGSFVMHKTNFQPYRKGY